MAKYSEYRILRVKFDIKICFIADHDTWLFPLIELPPVSVHMDSKVTTRILESADAGSTLHLATGYFNLTDDYTCTILKNSKAQYQFLIAHPSVNTIEN